MRRLAILATTLTLAACGSDGSTGGVSWGDPQIAVTSGAGQTHEAAAIDSLDEPVTAQLFREPETGGITLRRIIGPQLAHAQTPVQGIAGESVCAAGIGAVPLEAWNACDNTDSTGVATFYFEPGTVAADSSCAEIRAVVNGAQVVTDVVCASVEPGPLRDFVCAGTISGIDTVNVGDTIDIIDYVGCPRDLYGNDMDPAVVRATTPDSVIGWAWFDGSGDYPADAPSDPLGSGWLVTVPDTVGYELQPYGAYEVSLRLWTTGHSFGNVDTGHIELRVLP